MTLRGAVALSAKKIKNIYLEIRVHGPWFCLLLLATELSLAFSFKRDFSWKEKLAQEPGKEVQTPQKIDLQPQSSFLIFPELFLHN